MGSFTISAIPSQDSQVWDQSTEPIPHITLLYLSDTLGNVEQATEYIRHAASTLFRFGLMVDRRGVLGPKNADVLFFAKDYCTKKLEDFRTHLLANKDIRLAYHAEEQYPEWIPHLTLGYPDRPAKHIEYPIDWLSFDRIAFWTEEYDGPEFLLKDKQYAEMSMGDFEVLPDMTPEQALEHFGVKGMHWGQRRVVETNSSGRLKGGSRTYTYGQRTVDGLRYGSSGQLRISDAMSKGKTLEKARKEESKKLRKKLLVAGAIYAGVLLATHGPRALQSIANNVVNKRTAAAGARAAANLLADTRGIGAHKIVDLGYNAAKGVFE